MGYAINGANILASHVYGSGYRIDTWMTPKWDDIDDIELKQKIVGQKVGPKKLTHNLICPTVPMFGKSEFLIQQKNLGFS